MICPTVLATTPDDFRTQLERIEQFAERIQIDLCDGQFTPTLTIAPIQVWWPPHLAVDIHLMFARPLEQLETLVSLHPHMVIIHAEAEGDLLGMMEHMQKLDIQAGIALLQDTALESKRELIMAADHVLLFAGHLGSFGGDADMNMLKKVEQVRAINPGVEIGWDGGANLENVAELQVGGIDVINVGGAIQRANDPQAAYSQLTDAIQR
jgi:ribulose-phosphate 3-epimerase